VSEAFYFTLSTVSEQTISVSPATDLQISGLVSNSWFSVQLLHSLSRIPHEGLLQDCRNSKGSWRWCMTLRITGSVDFVHRSYFWTTRKRNVSKHILCWIHQKSESFPPPPQWLMLALSKKLNKVGVSFPLPEEGNLSNFRIVVFSSYLEFLTMVKVQRPSI
jgi:hypothetical protein